MVTEARGTIVQSILKVSIQSRQHILEFVKDVCGPSWETQTIKCNSAESTQHHNSSTNINSNSEIQLHNNSHCFHSVLFSWWDILSHLAWSLLEVEQNFKPLNSVDTPSSTLAKIFYAAFLFIGVILLVNMLIALLSNTYKRVEVSDLFPFFILWKG